MRYRPSGFTVMVGVGALLGLLFASVSTYDFVMHLDRQVHEVHCSFIPGLTGTHGGESGCQVTLISPYSSVLRTSIWGGIPISLPAMAVFGFLLAFAAELVVTRRERDVRASGFLALATGLPALTSVVMAYLSLVRLDAVCKLCIGIYVSSALCLTGALLLFFRARRGDGPEGERAGPAPRARPRAAEPIAHDAEPAWVGAAGAPEPEPEPAPAPAPLPAVTRRPPVTWGYLGAAFGVGVLCVAVPVTVYVAAAPDHGRFIGTCGALATSTDPSDVMVPLDPHPGAPATVEVLDPLCPACRGFEARLDATGLEDEMDRKAVLFPLDHTCNWMVDTTLHPGACTVSRAVLCAGDRAPAVVAWAFEHQDAVRAATAKDPAAAARMVTAAFPDLASCVDSAATRARLNRSLRWAVRNHLPVTTPQLYVSGVKLCEEDVDIGLDFALSHMLSRARAGTLTGEPPAQPTEPPDDTAAEPAHHAAPAPAAGNPPAPAAGNPPAPAAAPSAPGTPAAAAPAEGADAQAAPAPKPTPAKPPAETPPAAPAHEPPPAEDEPDDTAAPTEPAAPAPADQPAPEDQP
jgi:uncharacterized membrane protein